VRIPGDDDNNNNNNNNAQDFDSSEFNLFMNTRISLTSSDGQYVIRTSTG
jgi:hypothetical protein